MNGIILCDTRDWMYLIIEHNIEDNTIADRLSSYRSKNLPAFQFKHSRKHMKDVENCVACTRTIQSRLKQAGEFIFYIQEMVTSKYPPIGGFV